MPESPERKQTNLRLDPSLHLIMKGAKDVLGFASVDDVYDLAVTEFIAGHPEIIDPVLSALVTEKTVMLGAVERLRAARQTQS